MKKLFIFLLLMTLGVNNSYADPAAKRVRTDVSNFGTNLSSADTTVQKALETIDDMSLGNGSAIILDLADDGSNESTDLGEIAITNDTNSIFSEPTADKFLIDVSKNWPIADVADSASAGDAALDFFGAGVTAVTNADACTNIAGTGLSISGGTLNWSASGIAGHDSFSDFVANEHLDWTSDQGGTNIHTGNYPITGYIKADGTVPLTANWPAGAFGISGLTYLETDELYNSGGALKIQPDVQGDTIFYGDTDVANDAHGRKHTIKRMAAEGDRQIQFYIDAGKIAVLSTDTIYTVLGNPAAGKYLYTGNFYTYITSGNPTFQQYGNIGAVGLKYIQQQVNDATDYFELTREDANILGFDIQMPLSVTDSTGVVIGEDVAGGSSNEEGIVKLWSNGDNAFYSKFSTGTQTEIVEYVLPLAKGTAGQVMEVASVAGNVVTMEWDTDDSGGAPEGTAVLSTGEGGGTKFLREDGDGTCSWQAAGGGATALDDIGDPDAATTITMGDNEAITLTSAEDTGTVLTINMTDNDMAGNTFGLDIIHAGDANSVYQFMRCYDNTNDLQFSVTSNGNVTGGTLTSRSWMLNEGGNYISQRLNDTTTIVPEITLRKAADGTPTSDVSDGHYLGQVTFEGYYTDGYDAGATIRAIVDGTPGNTDMPSRLEFLTSADASATPTLRGLINSAGEWRFGDGVWTNYIKITSGGVMTSEGSASIAADTVTNATLTTALTVDTGTLTLTANEANNSVLTVGAGASSVSGANTGDQTINTADIADVSVIQTELAELETIGATTISANQWTALGGIAETLTYTELNLLDGIVTLSGSNTGDNTVATTGDSASAFFGEGTIEKERLPDASTTADGVVELATTAEVNTGTSTTLAATPDSIRDSNYASTVVMIRLLDEDTSHTVDTSIGGDYRIPFACTVIDVGAYFDTAGAGSVTTMDINEAGSTILSTLITIDATEKTSATAATPPVISDASYAADAIITYEVTGIASGTAGKGLVIWIQVIPTSL